MEAAIEASDFTRAGFDAVLALIKKYGGIAYARKRAQEHIDEAKRFLDIFDGSKPRSLLEDLADYVLARKM
ncbi:MAG: hypothetical protein HWN68_03045 [Desulfobacterales bacterium]|nr:hypothetical protein [Desulfobacterales bacterium]